MAETTKIAWCDATFNPWIGCTKVSAGCAHCYAENTTRARVLRGQGHETWGKGAQRSRTSAANWKAPLRWNSECEVHPDYRHKVFPSLCDWLDDEVPIEWLADFLRLIHDTPNIDWLLLTKRPENFFQRLTQVNTSVRGLIDRARNNEEVAKLAVWVEYWRTGVKAPGNVWFGTSVENQAMADKRIPELLKIPARIRFLSVEPMLGPIEFSDVTKRSDAVMQLGKAALDGIHWVIFGGESGPKARWCNVEWIRDGVRQCRAAEVAPFVKQLGSDPRYDTDGDVVLSGAIQGSSKVRINNAPLDLKDTKGGDISEFPEDLRVREFPK